MECLYGHVVVRGIACGPIYLLKGKTEYKSQSEVCNAEKEWERVHHACNRTMRQLEILTEETRNLLGEAAADIFEAHQMILMDEEFEENIREILQKDQVRGEEAVTRTGEKFSRMFAAMDMEYMQARAADIRDITDRIIQNMNEEEEQHIRQIKEEGPVVLCAESLNPSDIFRFGKESVLAIVTTKGSVTSHAAILARSMNIPAIIHVAGLNLDQLENGSMMIVDSEREMILLDPTPEEIRQAHIRQEKYRKEEKALSVYVGVESITKSGHKVNVRANITDIQETDLVNKVGGDGVGLYRSEFLFIGRKDFPTEEEQFHSYCTLIRSLNGKKAIVRTMDIGSDKPLSYFQMEEEKNPALGLRGIRVSLKYPELFKVQLRALLRAAVYGDLEIMYPLITSCVELDHIQKIMEEATIELEAEKLKYRVPRQGIMIETPAAVMISDELAKQVDFFSIGTNDLAQYALAIDRQNTDLNLMHNPQHEGIIRMIDMTIQAAHRQGIPVCVCGEMAIDATLLKRFVDMGVDGISVSTSQILRMRKILSEC